MKINLQVRDLREPWIYLLANFAQERDKNKNSSDYVKLILFARAGMSMYVRAYSSLRGESITETCDNFLEAFLSIFEIIPPMCRQASSLSPVTKIKFYYILAQILLVTRAAYPYE